MDNIFVIAEIGINHNGSIDLAKELIDIAVDSKCNAVKFQKRTVRAVYTEEELKKPRESPWGETTLDQKLGLEFEEEEYDEIDKYCKDKGIEWFASAWDIGAQKFLQRYNMPYNKIASAMLTCKDLLEMVAKEGKPTFISTGMSTMEQVDTAVNIFRYYKCPFSVMHCISNYPCENDECNVKCIETLKAQYPDAFAIGYSGHEKGLTPSLVAVVLGATVIERHITRSRTLYGSDQAASLEANGVKRLVRDAREVEKILGNGVKTVSQKELAVMKKLRKY